MRLDADSERGDGDGREKESVVGRQASWKSLSKTTGRQTGPDGPRTGRGDLFLGARSALLWGVGTGGTSKSGQRGNEDSQPRDARGRCLRGAFPPAPGLEGKRSHKTTGWGKRNEAERSTFAKTGQRDPVFNAKGKLARQEARHGPGCQDLSRESVGEK